MSVRKFTLGVVGFCLLSGALTHAQSKGNVDMSRDIVCAELDLKEVIKLLNEGSIEEQKIKEEEGVIYFEVGSDRIEGVEDFSPRNQILYKKDPEGFIKSVKKVPSFKNRAFSVMSEEKVYLSWRDGFGWGKMTQRTFEEIYLLSGEFSDLAKQLGRFTPKKTEDYYRQYYERILLGYPAGKIPFEKLDDETWFFGYARRLSAGDNPAIIAVKSICYLEKYAKSFEVVSVVTLDDRGKGKEYLDSLAKKEIDKLIRKNKSLVKMVLSQIAEKELMPNKKSISMLNHDRIGRTVGLGKTDEEKLSWTKNPKVPDFVKDLESQRLLQGDKE